VFQVWLAVLSDVLGLPKGGHPSGAGGLSAFSAVRVAGRRSGGQRRTHISAGAVGRRNGAAPAMA